MKSLAVLISGVLLAAGANAATLSYSFANAQATTDIHQSGSLGLFNSALGTLTGVSVSFDGSVTTDVTLTNKAAQNQTVRFQSTANLFFGSSLASLDALIQSQNPIIVLPSIDTGFVSLAGLGGSRSFGPVTNSLGVTYTSELSGFLNDFIGSGNFGVTCDSLNSDTTTGGGGNIDKLQNTTANCNGSITYTYEATPPNRVPEPASLALVGLALAGLGLSRKARKA